jgi:hypothetical protein
MIAIGKKLVDSWSLDKTTPAAASGGPGHWHFIGHDEAETIVIHGRKVLDEWRKARPGDWDRHTATEYARSVAALLEVRRIANEVAESLT